uniref:Coiled-coil domain-containing protein 50-like n=1 Tax=Erpetoichthys calabaricus TaxID=27687 RepID=A0A8C4S0Z6_ERPCA
MTHLEIDQTSLPCVQDVCQGFAVLEDGALAYNLQEQEIESHYAANIQKSQLLQRDVQIAKRLQEDERRRVGLSERLMDTEEQDSRYARAIHEEMRKREDELQMREAEDEVVAKRMQAEEELKNSRWYRHGEEEERPIRSGSTVEDWQRPCPAWGLQPSPSFASRDAAAQCHELLPMLEATGARDAYLMGNQGKDGIRPSVHLDDCGLFVGPEMNSRAVSCLARGHLNKRKVSSGFNTGSSEQSDHRSRQNVIGHDQENCARGSNHKRHGVKEERAGASGGRHGSRKERRRRSEGRRRERYGPPSSEEEEEEEEERRGRTERRQNPGGPSFLLHHAHSARAELGARLELRDLEQVLRDEEMARKLQAEEEAVAVNSEEDFRTAQVAQDEEIARFMQRRELKLQERSDTPVRRSSQRDCSDSAEGSGAPDRGEPKMGRRDSQSVSPGSKQGPASPGGIAASSRNIAEELDPTFQAPQQNGMLELTAGSLPGQELHTGERQTVSQVCPVPPCSFYDYMEDCPETFIVPPTRRSSQKLGRLKAKDKKESCKQQ